MPGIKILANTTSTMRKLAEIDTEFSRHSSTTFRLLGRHITILVHCLGLEIRKFNGT